MKKRRNLKKRRAALRAHADQTLPLELRERMALLRARARRLLVLIEQAEEAQDELLRRWRDFYLTRPSSHPDE